MHKHRFIVEICILLIRVSGKHLRQEPIDEDSLSAYGIARDYNGTLSVGGQDVNAIDNATDGQLSRKDLNDTGPLQMNNTNRSTSNTVDISATGVPMMTDPKRFGCTKMFAAPHTDGKKLINVGMVGTGLTSFSCAALKLGLRVVQGAAPSLDSSPFPFWKNLSKDVADVFGDIPFNFPEFITEAHHDRSSEASTQLAFVATARERESWVTQHMLHLDDGGKALRHAYNISRRDGGNASAWAEAYDKHMGYLKKYSVPMISTEMSGSEKFDVFCSAVSRAFGDSLAQSCGELRKALDEKWPHVDADMSLAPHVDK